MKKGPPALLTLGGRVFTGRRFEDGVLVGRDGLIEGFEPRRQAPSHSLVVPGFLDLHCHGCCGCDFTTASGQDLARMGEAMARSGLTGFVASLLPGPFDVIARAVERLKRVFTAGRDLPCLAGIHFEGPFVARTRPGALPLEALADPDEGLLERLLDLARPLKAILTVAPELPGALALIEKAHREGALVTVGHTDATYDETLEAIDRGARHATHLFNAMAGLHHRQPGPPGAFLTDPRTTVELVCDGIHLHPAMVRLVFASVRADRIAVVSDATAASLCEGPTVSWAGRTLHVEDGAARLSDGTLAGSTLPLSGGVANLRAWGVGLVRILRAASLTPNRILGLPGGRLSPGRPFDVTVLDADLMPVAAYARGRCLTVEGP